MVFNSQRQQINWALALAQLVVRLLPTPAIRGSYLTIDKTVKLYSVFKQPFGFKLIKMPLMYDGVVLLDSGGVVTSGRASFSDPRSRELKSQNRFYSYIWSPKNST